MQTEQKEKRIGVVVFLPSNIGSKSESLLPYLYKSKDEPLTRLMLKEDNPFENNGLLAYDALRVEVEGMLSPIGTFVVDSITHFR